MEIPGTTFMAGKEGWQDNPFMKMTVRLFDPFLYVVSSSSVSPFTRSTEVGLPSPQ